MMTMMYYDLSIFDAMETHLPSSGHLWQLNYFRTSPTTIDHARNCASRVYILLCFFYWRLGIQRVAGTHYCCELNNYIEYWWYVREELTIQLMCHL